MDNYNYINGFRYLQYKQPETEKDATGVSSKTREPSKEITGSNSLGTKNIKTDLIKSSEITYL